MTVPWIYLAVTIVGALFTLNAYVPSRHLLPAVVPSFFASWITIEMAAFHIAWQLVATIVFAYLGAFDMWPGWLGLAITLVSWVGLLLIVRQSTHTHFVMERALTDALGPDYRSKIRPELAETLTDDLRWRHLIFPLLLGERDVERVKNIAYGPAGRRNRLDIYRPKGGARNAPVLLQIHGGGWTIGSKQQQGQPLMQSLASRGWVCVAINYRLSPKVAFPDHLIDVKRALVWIRENIADYGGDPGFVAATGGSAGGHLSALMTLTGNEAVFQPGFEDADTSVQAGVPMYGLYDVRDFEERKWGEGFARFFDRIVMKADRDENPDLYTQASPAAWLREDSPSMFIVHGDKDVLLPVIETRRFVAKVRETVKNPVPYAELPGGQHAFDVFWSVRTGHVVAAISRFLTYEYSRYLDRADVPLR